MCVCDVLATAGGALTLAFVDRNSGEHQPTLVGGGDSDDGFGGADGDSFDGAVARRQELEMTTGVRPSALSAPGELASNGRTRAAENGHGSSAKRNGGGGVPLGGGGAFPRAITGTLADEVQEERERGPRDGHVRQGGRGRGLRPTTTTAAGVRNVGGRFLRRLWERR